MPERLPDIPRPHSVRVETSSLASLQVLAARDEAVRAAREAKAAAEGVSLIARLLGGKAESNINVGRGVGIITRAIKELLHRGVYDPRNYGARPGTRGTPEQVLARAQKNQQAFQAAADDFRNARLAGDLDAELLIPPGDWAIVVMPAVGIGHYVGPAARPRSDGWSCHGIVLDGQDLLYGGTVQFRGRLIRVQNDPMNLVDYQDPDATEPGTRAVSNGIDSGVFVTRWGGLSILGTVDHVGYQQGGKRAISSGDGFQASYGVYDLYIQALRGRDGANSAGSFGLNRRRGGMGVPGLTDPDPELEYDTTRPCRNIIIGEATGINGEHALLFGMVDGYHVGTVTVDRRPTSYGGVVDPKPDMQRGVVNTGARGYIHAVTIKEGPQKSGIFIACFPSVRSPFDIEARFGTINARANEGQDADDNVCVMLSDGNDGTGTYRRMRVSIETLRAIGYKEDISYQDSRNAGAPFASYVCEDDSVIDYFRIGNLDDCRSTARTIFLVPYGGSRGSIIIGKGASRVAPDALYSAVQRPIEGIHVQAYAENNYHAALENPLTRDAVEAIVRPKPGQLAYVTDWPGGARVVLFDPKAALASGLTKEEALKIGGWRPSRPPRPIERLVIESYVVTSGNRPGLLCGIRLLDQGGVRYTYEEMGVPEAVTRCLEVDQVDSFLRNDWDSSDGLSAKQRTVSKPVPARNLRRVIRNYVKDYGPIAAGTHTAADDFGMAGIRKGDDVRVTCDTEFPGLMAIAGCYVDGVARVRLHNRTGATIDPTLATWTLMNYAASP